MSSKEGHSDRLDISFILAPNDLESVPELVQKIDSLSAELFGGSHDKRAELLAQAQALVQALETPQETMLKHLWASVSLAETSSPLISAYLAHSGLRELPLLHWQVVPRSGYSSTLPKTAAGQRKLLISQPLSELTRVC